MRRPRRPGHPATTASEPARAHANNFDALRLGFAILVVYSHAHALSGYAEPVAWNGTLGNVAVHGFFAVSGYLVTGSFTRSRDLPQFSLRRARRIVPGLVVAMVVATLLGRAFGGYTTNPVPFITNGPVWTLTWEAVAYVAVGLLGLVGVVTRAALPVVVAACWLAYLVTIGTTDPFALAVAPMLLVFAGGAVLWLHPELLRRGVVVAAALGLLLTLDNETFAWVARHVTAVVPFLYAPTWTPVDVQTSIYLLCLPVVVVALGRASWPFLRLPVDLSYGTYLYAWPVSQVAVALASREGRDMSPLALFVITLVPTLLIATASWFCVERPVLRFRRQRPGRRQERETTTGAASGS